VSSLQPQSSLDAVTPAAQRVSVGSERQAWTVGEFCDAFRISRSNLYKMISDDVLRTVVIGGRRLIPVSEGRRLLEADSQMSQARESYFQRKRAERLSHVAEAAET
jgi:hypothetical protein